MDEQEKYRGDPLGYAMMDYVTGSEHHPITVYSNLTSVEYLPVEYLMRHFDQMPAIEQRALDECSGKVLDVGAGAGSHVLELQKRGFEVEAIDISAGAVEAMKLRGVKNASQKDFFRMMPGDYDTLLLLMNGIGIVGDIEGLRRFLEHAKKFLSNNGQILLDSSDITYMYIEDDNSLRVELSEAYYGIVYYRLEYKGVTSTKFKWLFIDFDTLWHKARNAGFHCEMLAEESNFHYLAKLTLK
ncbi:MAG: methyltransferase domain-containing protein [Bacteroidales bacterium]|nr:methyltransferase domain-containing protein [Bacteroidales bacterium]